ncbi:MAG: divergent polysaccharide deacetylase family protein [Rhizomicrobium sp.]
MTDTGNAGDLRRDSSPALALAGLVLACLVLLFLATIALFGRASDGVPVFRLDLHLARRSAAAHPALPQPTHAAANTNLIGAGPPPISPVAPSAPPASAAGSNAATPAAAPAAKTASTPLPPVIVAPGKIDKPVYAGRALIADPALIEMTPDGPLPRIADNGRTPLAAYAPPVPAGARLRIALVMSGLGMSARKTSAALDKLPPQVTLAFAPYTDDAQRWIGEARKRGHEVLLEVPMEPDDFPDSDPGPHTLRASVSEESNAQRLTWSLTRFTGYVGITNLLGGRFLADSDSVAPVMTFLERRGLMFFDSGPANRSVAPDAARQTGTAYVQSNLEVDTIQTAMEIDARLSDLETRARQNGSAAGTAFVDTITIDRIANWANGLAGRGFVLVPASAIVSHPK